MAAQAPINFRVVFVGMPLPGRRTSRTSIRSKIRQPETGHIHVALQNEDLNGNVLQTLLRSALVPQTGTHLSSAFRSGVKEEHNPYWRAHLVTKKSESFNGSNRKHFAPLYPEEIQEEMQSVLTDNDHALAAIRAAIDRAAIDRAAIDRAAMDPRRRIVPPFHEVVFILSLFKTQGVLRCHDLDTCINLWFVGNLKACWQAQGFDCQVADVMKVSLRDSILEDLFCVDSSKEDVFMSLISADYCCKKFGLLVPLVVLKSDTFSHFAHCDENCQSVKVSMPLHLEFQEDGPAPQHVFRGFLEENFADLADHVYRQTGNSIIDDFATFLQGLSVEVFFRNLNKKFCTLKLIFEVDRRNDTIAGRADVLSQAINEHFRNLNLGITVTVDVEQCCLAKGVPCPSCGFTSDTHSMFSYRRESGTADDHLCVYKKVFECASAALPSPPAGIKEVCRGFDRGHDQINWMRRINPEAEGQRHLTTGVSLSTFRVGDTLLTNAVSSYSSDFGSNLTRYATPAKGFHRATAFVVLKPQMNSRFVDPISVVPFLAPDFKESECHIAKDTELYLTEFKQNFRGNTRADDCDTFVFKLVKNFNTLNSPRDIEALNLPGVKAARAARICFAKIRAGPPKGFSSINHFLGFIKPGQGLGIGIQESYIGEIKLQLTHQVKNGDLSFGFLAPEAVQSPPPRGASKMFTTPDTTFKDSRPAAIPGGTALDGRYSVPILYPLFFLGLSRESRNKLREQGTLFPNPDLYDWTGGVLPNGSCHKKQSGRYNTKMVFTFKQLLRTRFERWSPDGSRYPAYARKCSKTVPPVDGVSVLLEDAADAQRLLREAAIVDSFMDGLRDSHDLTQQGVMNLLQIAKEQETETHTDGTNLIVGVAFLRHCREVIFGDQELVQCFSCKGDYSRCRPYIFNDVGGDDRWPNMQHERYSFLMERWYHHDTDFDTDDLID
jgi:hypothetical protein